jgi:hypothetical protein
MSEQTTQLQTLTDAELAELLKKAEGKPTVTVFEHVFSALVSDYMRLRGIVQKLPVTKDGVSVVPGEDEVWLCNQSGKATSRAIETSMPECCEWPCVLISEVGKCYSTEEAALAAQTEVSK